MIFRNPLKDRLHIVEMVVIAIASTALAIIACVGVKQLYPLMTLFLIYACYGSLFIVNKMIRILYAVLLLCGIAYIFLM